MKIIKKLFPFFLASMLCIVTTTMQIYAVGPEERKIANLRLKAAGRIAEEIIFNKKDPAELLKPLPEALEEYVQFIVDHQFDLKKMVLDAAKYNLTDYLKDFLSTGITSVSPDIHDEDFKNTPLHWAVSNLNSKNIKLLLAAEVDINAENRRSETPLMLAAKNQYNIRQGDRIIKKLVRRGANVDQINPKNNYTALLYALKHNRPVIAEFLLEKTKNSRLYITYWMWATMYDNPPILQWLLSNNHVTINQRETVSSKNATALHMGVKSFHLALTKDRVPEAIEFLVNHGANIEAVDSDNKTPLHYAAKKDENLVIANYLLDRGARVNTTDSKHQTPLIIAAKKGALVLVKLLLDHGANITIRDNDQKSALDYAREKGAHKPGYEEVIELLEQAEQRQ